MRSTFARISALTFALASVAGCEGLGDVEPRTAGQGGEGGVDEGAPPENDSTGSVHDDGGDAPLAVTPVDDVESGLTTPPAPVPAAPEGHPEAPILMLGAPSIDNEHVEVWWLPARDDTTPPEGMTYRVHVGSSSAFQPDASNLAATIEGAEHAMVPGAEIGATVFVAVVPVDADGNVGPHEEPIEIQMPDAPVELIEGVVVHEWYDLPVDIAPGRVSVPREAVADVPGVGEVLVFSLRQAPSDDLAMHAIEAVNVDDERIVFETVATTPTRLVASGELTPTVRFFDVPADAGTWAPDPTRPGWETREVWLGDVGFARESRPLPRVADQQKSCGALPWWTCVANAVSADPLPTNCTTVDIETQFWSGGANRFGYGCHWSTGPGPSFTCDMDGGYYPASAYSTFDAFGQSDNGRVCLSGDVDVAIQGQWGIGGNMYLRYGATSWTSDIGEGWPPCDDDGTRPDLPDCTDDEAREYGAGGRSEAQVAGDSAEVRFLPRFLGGVDISARAEGSAGISIEYEFFDLSKTYRAGPWIWVTLGTNLIAEASAEASGVVETGVNVSMGTQVGINTGIAYDGSRDGPPSEPYIYRPSQPSTAGPEMEFLLRPTFEPRLDANGTAYAQANVRMKIYVLFESTVYFEIGPEAKIEATLGIGPGSTTGPACTSSPDGFINQFDIDFSVGPAMKFEVQWPFTGSAISTPWGTTAWDWPLADPLWGAWTYLRNLHSLPIWRLNRAESFTQRTRQYLGHISACPGERARMCVEQLSDRSRYSSVDWGAMEWIAPAFIDVLADEGCLVFDVPTSSAGQTGLVEVKVEPESLGSWAETCGARYINIGDRSDGCRWEGDGVCDNVPGYFEECGTLDCPITSPPTVARCSCGNGTCDPSTFENCGTCPGDCGACAPPVTVLPGGFVRIDTTDPLDVRWNSWDGSGSRTVNLTRDFYIQTTEVTQQQYFDVLNAVWAAQGQPNHADFAACRAGCDAARFVCPDACPSGHDTPGSVAPCPTCPVDRPRLVDAMLYANALSVAELGPGTECYGIEWDATLQDFVPVAVRAPAGDVTQCVGYRLPTEAEWEYAYRYTGSGSPLQYTDLHDGQNFDPGPADPSTIGWVRSSFGASTNEQPQPTAGRAASPAGLYDMTGNVWEWTWTTFDPLTVLPASTDPGARSRADSDLERVVRGGSFATPDAWSVGGANEGGYLFTEAPYTSSFNVGFRVVRTAW